MAATTDAELDETFDALTHPYRRYVLYYLRAHSEGVSVDTLSAVLAEELQGPSAMGEGKTPEQIEVALHHTHLPKLADTGFITFDPERQSVALDEINDHGQVIDQAARHDGYAPPAGGD